jgi:hypothetical protein
MDVAYGDYKKMPESDIAHIIEVDDNDDSNTEVEEIHLEGCENNETMDDEQDPESSVDENQFTGIDGNDSDEETMDKLDTEVLVPPDLKVAWELSKLSAYYNTGDTLSRTRSEKNYGDDEDMEDSEGKANLILMRYKTLQHW